MKTWAVFNLATRVVEYTTLTQDDTTPLVGADQGVEMLTGPLQTPGPNLVLNIDTKQWEDPRTLADLKSQKWTEVKAARDVFEFGSFVHNALEFDCNQISQQRIGQAAQGAMFALSVGAPFTQGWTLKDNLVVTFDAPQMIGVALAMGEHIGYAHTRSRVLREQLYSLETDTPEKVQAINWDTA